MSVRSKSRLCIALLDIASCWRRPSGIQCHDLRSRLRLSGRFSAVCLASDVFDGGADRVHSTKYLYLLHAGPHVNRLLTPRIATALMDVDLLWPFFCSFAILLACILLIWLFYQELPLSEVSKGGGDYDPLPQESYDGQGSRLSSSSNSRSTTLTDPLSGSYHISDDQARYARSPSALNTAWWWETNRLISRLFSPPTATFCLAGMLFKRIAFASEGFIFQYTSEKFGWKLKETTWLRFSAAIGAIVTTMMVCPLLTQLCKRNGYNTHKLDLWIIRVCLGVLVLSFLIAFEAPSASWLLLGTTFTPVHHSHRLIANLVFQQCWAWVSGKALSLPYKACSHLSPIPPTTRSCSVSSLLLTV